MKTALIDADVLLYRIGFGKADESTEFACAALDESLYTILDEVDSDKEVLWLSDSENFRYKVYSGYKAGRPPRPEHYAALKDHMLTAWSAKIAEGMEADDALSLGEDDDAIIVSIDKDLLQVPGTHYNFVKKEWRTVSRFEALYNFYHQMLTGDAVDKVPGVKGIGPKKATKLLENCISEENFYDIVRSAYKDDAAMLINCKLLWLKSTKRTNMILRNHELEGVETCQTAQA